MAQIIKTLFQIKRDTEANWLKYSSYVPRAGEPCLTLDGEFAHQVKFGDGVKTWAELPYSGVVKIEGDGKTIVFEDGVISLVGAESATAGQTFKISADGTSLEWFTPAENDAVVEVEKEVVTIKEIMTSTQNTITNLQEVVSTKANADDVYTKSEVDDIVSKVFNYCGTVDSVDTVVDPKQGDVYQLAAGGFQIYDGDSWEDFGVDIDLSPYLTIEEANAALKQIKYEVAYKPANTLVNYRDKEIRVMCPADTKWSLQNSGENANPNAYYIGFKAYAPNNAVSFKEDLAETIADDTMYYFENNEFAGIDKFGRKYSIVWLPAAAYDVATETWTYYGSMSSDDRYIGWYYSVKWYDVAGAVVDSDTIRINLSNEECHDAVKPFYMAPTVASEDAFGMVKSSDDENKIRVADDGTMEIVSLSLDKLVQADGTTMIFDGGDASNM